MFLDEPTSALDARSEQQMYQEFLATDTGQTILFVTHRMSAVHLADRVLFFEKMVLLLVLHRTPSCYELIRTLPRALSIAKRCL